MAAGHAGIQRAKIRNYRFFGSKPNFIRESYLCTQQPSGARRCINMTEIPELVKHVAEDVKHVHDDIEHVQRDIEEIS